VKSCREKNYLSEKKIFISWEFISPNRKNYLSGKDNFYSLGISFPEQEVKSCKEKIYRSGKIIFTGLGSVFASQEKRGDLDIIFVISSQASSWSDVRSLYSPSANIIS
jgi:hypothetical protein